MFLSQHLKQFAFLSFSCFVIFELSLSFLVCGDLGLLVVLEGPILGTTHVPCVQQQLPGSVVLSHHVDRQLVILQQSVSKNKHPPKIPDIESRGGVEVVTTVQEGL